MKLFEKGLKKDLIDFSFENGFIYSKINKPEKLSEIIEIIEFSKPLLETKITIGYKLFKKYPQLLY